MILLELNVESAGRCEYVLDNVLFVCMYTLMFFTELILQLLSFGLNLVVSRGHA